jgi:PDZ domain-containing secreted protein
VVAAENAGAKYFLVPNTPDNVGPARAGAHSIKVVPVSSLRQALTFLNSLTPCR